MHEKTKHSDAIECKWTQCIGNLFPEEPTEVKALERSVKKESEMQVVRIVLTSFDPPLVSCWPFTTFLPVILYDYL